SKLVVPIVDDVLAAPVQPCSFRTTEAPLSQ
ncbi:MAG: hypothetical protein QOF58_7983, partial [Pseudonocardiales bacterium]|nr:hypothetical protein [Pseudonocardiales bacterium]